MGARPFSFAWLQTRKNMWKETCNGRQKNIQVPRPGSGLGILTLRRTIVLGPSPAVVLLVLDTHRPRRQFQSLAGEAYERNLRDSAGLQEDRRQGGQPSGAVLTANFKTGLEDGAKQFCFTPTTWSASRRQWGRRHRTG